MTKFIYVFEGKVPDYKRLKGQLTGLDTLTIFVQAFPTGFHVYESNTTAAGS